MREDLEKLTKEELINYIEDLSKNWLAIDGTWFQVAEREYGLERAIELDVEQWKRFTVIEAKRIMKSFNIPKNGGIPALVKALKFRVYANINVQEILEVSENRCVFRMNNCRVQFALNTAILQKLLTLESKQNVYAVLPIVTQIITIVHGNLLLKFKI
jgi:hypothetical protein